MLALLNSLDSNDCCYVAYLRRGATGVDALLSLPMIRGLCSFCFLAERLIRKIMSTIGREVILPDSVFKNYVRPNCRAYTG